MNSSFADIESLLMRHGPRLAGNGVTTPTSGRRNITDVSLRNPAAARISPLEQQAYVQLSEAGHTPSEIGDMYGRAPHAIRYVLRKHGAKINSVRLKPQL